MASNPPVADPRQIKGTLPKMVLSYLRRALGQEAVDRVLEMAGQRRSTTELSQAGSWTSRDETLAVVEAAEKLCGDTDIGRRAGEELMRISYERGTIDFIRATGSIVAALEMATNEGTKMSTGRVIELTDHGDDWATIVGYSKDASVAHPFFCGIAAGYYGLVPEIFGASGVITEPECQNRGDARCVYRLTWSTKGSAARLAAPAVEESRVRTETFIERFEQLHTMATRLAESEEVDTLLARISDQAGLAVGAPRYLLAVRTHDDGTLRIHHKGFAVDGAERFAARMLAGELREDERCLVADVASSDHFYGRIAVICPTGSSITEMERRLLAAYARHAAAALEAVASLENARRDRDTAQALLELADALATVGTRRDVAARMAAAIPAISGCVRAGVWLWDEACKRSHSRVASQTTFP